MKKDGKGGILPDWEVRRSNGRYMYRYTDAGGVAKTKPIPK
ncbi:MAG: integrase DNA-binding domain-containing protein [Candidatus Heteroscillospira sp.]